MIVAYVNIYLKTFLGVSLLFLKMITVLGVETGSPPPSIMTEMTETTETRGTIT